MKKNEIKNHVGDNNINNKPLTVFDKKSCDFLDELSKEIRKDNRSKDYPDVISFSFWCRKSNINKIKNDFQVKELRVGRGKAFHIAPSNVPVNFAFSLAFGILSGNTNVIRISSKEFPQVKIICDSILKVTEKNEFNEFKKRINIISYEKNKDITDEFSKNCDIRVIWGGDLTIQEVRKSAIGSRCIEIAFSDRYSFGLINAKNIINSTKEEINELALKFYNDTFLMDQNACSAPHLIIWIGEGEELKEAKRIFWEQVFCESKKYDLTEKKVIEKYNYLTGKVIETDVLSSVKKYENYLYVIELKKLDKSITEMKGKFGMFFEYSIKEIEEIPDFINGKVQTCLFYGIDKEKIHKIIIERNLSGIDRVVPFGESLNIGPIWDGYDIIRTMSRIII